MRPRTSSLVLLAWAVTTLWAASSLRAQSAFLEGTVATEGGAPLPGMIVAAYTTAGDVANTNVTGGNGGFVLSLPPATYRLLAYDANGDWATSFYHDASSFETSAEITLAAGERRTGIDLRLRRGFRIHGTVSSADGAPLPGMVVSAYNLDGTRRGHRESGANGEYTLTLPAGQYKLAAWDDAQIFAPQFYASARSFSSASTLALSANVFQIDFSLQRGAKVTGTVSVEGTGQPLAGIEISAYEMSGDRIALATSGAAGGFSLALPPGRYKFSASDPQDAYLTEFFSDVPGFGAAASLDLSAGQSRTGVDFTLTARSDPPAPATLFIPAAINTAGAEESYWRTDVWIYNPSQQTLPIVVAYLTGTQTPLEATITVSPRGQMAVTNVLETLFGSTGLGALRLTAPHAFAAVSRTFSTPPDASTAGTFGFSIAAMTIGRSMGRGALQGIAHGTRYRTNFGIMNPHEYVLTVQAHLYSAAGTLLGERGYRLEPLSVQQPSVAELLPAQTELSDGYLVLDSDEGSFFSYVAVVDNRSNDPTLVLPTADEP